ncbi:MAG: phosphatase PAP2 family protein [Candidatus Bruticola sp.]
MKKSPYVILLATLLAAVLFYEIRPLFAFGMFFHKSLTSIAQSNILFMTACLGGACAYWFLLPIRKTELIAASALGLAIDGALINYRLAHIINDPLEEHLLCVADLGPGLLIGAVLAILWRIFQHIRQKQSESIQKCLEVLGLTLAMPIILSLASVKCDPYVYDPHCYTLDSLWGTQISFIISKFLRSSLPLRLFMTAVYVYLSLYMMIAQVIVYKDNERLGLKHSRFLIPAFYFILIGVWGGFLYEFFPVVGVDLYCGQNRFPDGPWPAANMNPVPIAAPPQFIRNGMPSLHLAWILAVYYSLYRAKPIYRYAALGLIFLTVLSTFSVGCHYLIDLLIGVPFCTASLAAVMTEAPKKLRFTSFTLCTAATLIWLAVFKYSIHSALAFPILTNSLLIITDLISLYLAHLLCRQSADEIKRIVEAAHSHANPTEKESAKNLPTETESSAATEIQPSSNN